VNTVPDLVVPSSLLLKKRPNLFWSRVGDEEKTFWDLFQQTRRRPSALEVPSLKRGRRLSAEPLTDPSENLLVSRGAKTFGLTAFNVMTL
jgi:hypothetical protein